MYATTGPAPPAPTKPEARLATSPPPTPPPASTSSSPPRRQKPRQVIYKSSALHKTDPTLVSLATPAALSASCGIKRAAATAERVRDEFKLAKCGPEIDVGEGDDEATNAKKYERRLLMNRHSAAASRVRREAYTKALEAQVVQQEASLVQVQKMLEMERETIQRMLADREIPPVEHSDVDSEVAIVQEEQQEEGDTPDVEDVTTSHMGDISQPIEDAFQQEFDLRSFPPHVLRPDLTHPLPPLTVMESQTEENPHLQTARFPVSSLQNDNDAHLPIHFSHPTPKPEELLFPDEPAPLPVELVPMSTNEQLLSAFILDAPIGVGLKDDVRVDNALDLL